ncbi:alpha/beta fold hydrolase [Salisediminibacterium halotolerans]|uniref:Pimeloyl-ACP methyl ester carboxylesterase n=1 Tax=Salisediminibacterium halotolerans TaxID=517425 RepID=A0A1H9RCJ3_9BACI|nr:alpha/beta hydrolase [Salisediminibacterium haloalkalitolerans]SER70265.1 Pimeloyl-ACP methyl ester carboxylesterase [Salisediminibacterium haloalkalitolerans]
MKRDHILLERQGIPIEYTVSGEGEPVLMLHGGHSSCREELGVGWLVEAGYKVIVPSRPGYGRTSKAAGKDLAAVSETIRAVLHHAGEERAHIAAFSAAGPAGIAFAAAYPKRTLSLSLLSAVSKPWPVKADGTGLAVGARIMFRPRLERATWALIHAVNKRFPDGLFRQMIPAFSTLDDHTASSVMTENDIAYFQQMMARQRSSSGFFLDLAHNRELTKEMAERVTAPTLILHSRYDASVNKAHAEYAKELIPHADLVMLNSWGHLIMLGTDAEAARETWLAFLYTNRSG